MLAGAKIELHPLIGQPRLLQEPEGADGAGVGGTSRASRASLRRMQGPERNKNTSACRVGAEAVPPSPDALSLRVARDGRS